MLLKWHESDPVCEFDIARNARSYTYQNNRNPVIDHPEFADMIWC
jgi:endonuclease I